MAIAITSPVWTASQIVDHARQVPVTAGNREILDEELRALQTDELARCVKEAVDRVCVPLIQRIVRARCKVASQGCGQILFLAVRERQPDLFHKIFVERYGMGIGQDDKERATIQAAKQGMRQELEQLLSMGITIRSPAQHEVLLAAAEGGHLSCLEYLCHLKIQWEQKQAEIAASKAMLAGHVECFLFLKKAGVTLSLEEQRRILTLAVQRNLEKSVEELLKTPGLLSEEQWLSLLVLVAERDAASCFGALLAQPFTLTDAKRQELLLLFIDKNAVECLKRLLAPAALFSAGQLQSFIRTAIRQQKWDCARWLVEGHTSMGQTSRLLLLGEIVEKWGQTPCPDWCKRILPQGMTWEEYQRGERALQLLQERKQEGLTELLYGGPLHPYYQQRALLSAAVEGKEGCLKAFLTQSKDLLDTECHELIKAAVTGGCSECLKSCLALRATHSQGHVYEYLCSAALKSDKKAVEILLALNVPLSKTQSDTLVKDSPPEMVSFFTPPAQGGRLRSLLPF